MATGERIRTEREKKLERMRKAGVLAYPGKVKRTHTIAEAQEEFNALRRTKKEVILGGRVRTLREHGGSTFFDIQDGSARIQCYIKRDGVGERQYESFGAVVDTGDIVQIRGTLFVTKKGERTLEVAAYTMLAKALLPLPDKWHGLRDVEERYRKRSLDLLFNEEVRKKFVRRAQILQAIRAFLAKEGFLEVETPVLQPLYGGAEATPFKTHLNAFDMDMYLRIAPELYLKRLVVGGFEKVYEIGRVFRNEGVDRTHNPDFTMLEFYWAYADYKDMMKLTERLILFILKAVHGSSTITYEGVKIDFGKKPWPRVEYEELFKKYLGLDIVSLSKEALFREAVTRGVSVEKSFSKERVTDALYKKHVRSHLQQPMFVIHYPTGMMPLAKPLDENPSKLGAFQLLVAGVELIKAYTELNDPVAQREIFVQQEKLFVEGLQDAQRMDEDFLEALEYGMPPTAGFGMGIDRLTALLTDSHSLREVILFPTMKQKT